MSSSIKSKRNTEELPIRVLMRFIAWIFVGLIILDVGLVLFLGLKADSISEGLNHYTVPVFLISAFISGSAFHAATQLKENVDVKNEIIKQFYIGVFMVGIIAILVASAYQW
ncbi:MAG: hypothetical protein ACTSU2_00895 [Promethearchaeota archaeon]